MTVAGSAQLPAARGRRRRRFEKLPLHAYGAAERVARALPQRMSYWLGDRAADAMLLAAPRRFDPLRENLSHVVPGTPSSALDRLVRRNLRNLTHGWIDIMAMSSPRTNLPARIDIQNLDRFTGAVARRHGVVVASMHFGAWEVGLAGWNAMGGSMALLAEVLQPKELFDRVIGSRVAQGVHVIPIDVQAMRTGDPLLARRIGASSMREVFRVLRSGGVVAIALDRDMIGNGEPLDFFGAPAPIPVGAVEIAIRAGAAIVPVILYRNGRRVYAVVHDEVHYSADAPREAEVRKTARVVLDILEDAIRRHPEQWHVLDPVWPSQPGGERTLT